MIRQSMSTRWCGGFPGKSDHCPIGRLRRVLRSKSHAVADSNGLPIHLAAALTSPLYLPQLQKAIPPNSTSDLSLRMLALSAGLSLCVVYRVLKDDWVISLAQFGRRNILTRCRTFVSGVQPEKACDKEDDDDDADDVENVHGILRVRQARFHCESAALQQETCRSATKFRSPRPELRSLAPLRLHILRRYR
jgi:hypothetical protein